MDPIIDKSGNTGPLQDNSEMLTLRIPKASADALKQVLDDLKMAIDQAEGKPEITPNDQSASQDEMTDSQQMQKEIEAMSNGGQR